MQLLYFITPHAQRERGKVIGCGVHICLWSKQIFESYFRFRLTFSNIRSRTSCRIYRLVYHCALQKCSPRWVNQGFPYLMRTLLYFSVGWCRTIPSVSIVIYKLTWNLPWNGASPFPDQTSRMQNWKEVNVWSSTVYSCDFHEGFHNIVDVCVEFCFIL